MARIVKSNVNKAVTDLWTAKVRSGSKKEEYAMNLHLKHETPSSNITEAEWSSRVEAAAGYRLMDLYDLSDLTEGVVGVRVVDEPDAFLVQPYGMFFDEVSASDLFKVKFGDQPDVGRGRPLNFASCNQVKFVLEARSDTDQRLHPPISSTMIHHDMFSDSRILPFGDRQSAISSAMCAVKSPIEAQSYLPEHR